MKRKESTFLYTNNEHKDTTLKTIPLPTAQNMNCLGTNKNISNTFMQKITQPDEIKDLHKWRDMPRSKLKVSTWRCQVSQIYTQV